MAHPGMEQPGQSAAATPFKDYYENNPGTYEEMHRKCKDVLPMIFEGVKVMVQKGMSNHFQISHTLSLTTAGNSYRFGSTYVGNKQFGPNEAFPVMLGDTDFNGNVSATMIHQFTPSLRGKLQAQVSKAELQVAQATVEYKRRLSTLALTMANVDLVNESGVVVMQYLRRVMPRLDLGVELLYSYGRHLPGERRSNLSYAARYNGDWCTLSGAVSRSALQLCYHHKQQDDIQFGVEWETNAQLQESVATLAYQVDVPAAGAVIRATADTHWTIGCVVEKKLLPLPFTLAMSAIFNHPKQQSKVGLGLIIGG